MSFSHKLLLSKIPMTIVNKQARMIEMKSSNIEKVKMAIPRIANKHISFMALFGSRAKDSAKEDSDYDILIDFEKGYDYSLFEISAIKQDIENALEARVDLVTKKSIHPRIRQNIISTMKVVYDR